MGGGGGRTVEYVQAPTPQQAPQRTAEEISYLEQQKQQMADMQKAYQSNLENLNKQYAQAQQQSASVLQQLQASSLAQQQAADRTRADMSLASEASNKQLSLLAASRDQAVGQSAEMRAEQTNRTGSIYDRLSRRRQARRTTY
jgi:transketolase